MINQVKSYTVGSGGVGAYRVVKFGSSDANVVTATAATDLSIGVTDRFAGAAGERVDVFRGGFCKVTAGGDIARGKRLVPTTGGKVIEAAANASPTFTIGVAEVSGADGEIIEMFLAPSLGPVDLS